MPDSIKIQNASENNLKNVSLEIPKNKLVVVTGVSGSGKSSLVYDVIFREAENRYLGSFSSYARQFMGKMRQPRVEKIEGLSPAIAINQKSIVRNPRSTVGTLTGIYDYLRLIYARFGESEIKDPAFKINRNLFSFNNPAGACPHCKGLGVEDKLDPELLVEDPNKTLREGALVITTPSGYIIYSQVTMEVLNQVCESEGFNVDIPWKDLTEEQKHIVLYGSDKIEIPYGKHTLESRMRWSGITAKPRETGYYKGILPVMENILQRDRNKNILRFVRSEKCSVCEGKRLNEKALSVEWLGKNIAELSEMPVRELTSFFKANKKEIASAEAAQILSAHILTRTELLENLGTGHLSLSRESTTLSGGEAQRLRLASQVNSELKGVIYIFDEPSIGLHVAENRKMIKILKQLRDKGNTVIVVEHEDDFIHEADHLIDIGPGAGIHGGEVLLNTSTTGLENVSAKSATLDYLSGSELFPANENPSTRKEAIQIKAAAENNLQQIDVTIRLFCLNVVTGVSGSGKSTLTEEILGKFLHRKLHGSNDRPGKFQSITGWEKVKKLISINQSPIGRTPRSNPATYTKLFDQIRNLFAALPESKARGWGKGRFSFNNKGGRCESCQGAGYKQIGMHFMGDVEIVCEECNGKRFNEETLQVKYHDRNIYEVLELSIEEAVEFFRDEKKSLRTLQSLHDLGLGYLKLGQRSTTLSGGEAQRVKLAAELSRPGSQHTLYILDEPTTGLHNADVKVLLKALQNLKEQNNTLLIIEHHLGMIAAADHIIDLGPGSGSDGGQLMAEGPVNKILSTESSLTGKALKDYLHRNETQQESKSEHKAVKENGIIFKGVNTHNLKDIDVTFPPDMITVVTGVSGSGKSSLVFDTLYAEGRNRFLESYSAYIRSRIGMEAAAAFSEVYGLTPTLAISRQGIKTSSRSTVGTMTGIYTLFTLMYSRIGKSSLNIEVLSSLFSFNHEQGACPRCGGMGEIVVGDPEKLVTNPGKSLVAGALDATKTGKFYGDPYGQYVHTLLAAGERHQVDFSLPWNELDEKAKELAMYGSGNEKYIVTWKYKRGKRSGEHHFEGTWPGFVNLVNEEYQRKHADSRGESMMDVMKSEECPQCQGARLNNEALSFEIQGKNIAELSALDVEKSIAFFKTFETNESSSSAIKISKQLRKEIRQKLSFLQRLGVGYLSIDRSAPSLSGGEAQRVKLAAQLSHGLTDMTIILDEPTVGLHPSDTTELIKIIRELRDKGNAVVMVEHDPHLINEADFIIELGPGAGIRGGKLIATGSPEEIKQKPESLTAQLLVSPQYQASSSKGLSPGIILHNICEHNLKIEKLHIPSGGIIALTGVSGSGKSTLLFDVILTSYLSGTSRGCEEIKGLERFDQVLEVSRENISASSHSNTATITGIFDSIREIFASTEKAKMQGLKKSHFSFNTPGGRCEKCQGKGHIDISMDFLTDVEVICDECNGKRYNENVLECSYKSKNIYDVLEMTIEEAMSFFDHKKITHVLATLTDSGLDYLKLGQTTSTFSGGESQRLKMARELIRRNRGKKLFLFDEPSTGLHLEDIKKLNKLFDKLSAEGNTLIIVEHDPAIIMNADYIIDLGPGGGDNGGRLVAEGTPAEVIKSKESLTAKALVNLVT